MMPQVVGVAVGLYRVFKKAGGKGKGYWSPDHEAVTSPTYDFIKTALEATRSRLQKEYDRNEVDEYSPPVWAIGLSGETTLKRAIHTAAQTVEAEPDYPARGFEVAADMRPSRAHRRLMELYGLPPDEEAEDHAVPGAR